MTKRGTHEYDGKEESVENDGASNNVFDRNRRISFLIVPPVFRGGPVNTDVRRCGCPMENEKRQFPAQFSFLRDCDTAISDERYRDALEIVINGLLEAFDKAQTVNSKDLTLALLMTVGTLESTLERAFGTDWEDRIPEISEDGKKIRCSFCGKAQEEVLKIIAGPTVYICNECIGVCNEIISEQTQP